MDLVQKILQGDIRAAARLMSMIENGTGEAVSALKALYPHTGKAYVVGVTGPPGSGKSTLVDGITEELRRLDKAVGIVAVDPTSPFTGGAILADRIRMQRHSLDAGVFIRSMATRGHLGGLARATNDVVDILDAAGKDYVIIEMVLHLGKPAEGWQPKVLKTVAVKGEGVAELTQAVLGHQAFMQAAEGRRLKGKERSRWVFWELLQEQVTGRVVEKVVGNGTLERLIDRIAARETERYSAVEEILRKAGL